MTVLPRLVRYHRHLLDEKRRDLRALEERSVSIEAAIDDLDSTVIAEQVVARTSQDATAAYGGFARASLDRRKSLAEELIQANAEVENARDELLDMFAEVKRYEIGLERHQEEERLLQDRRSQGLLDEAALNLYRRRDPR